MSLGCSSPDIVNSALLNEKGVSNCIITDRTCQLYEKGCDWYTCDALTDTSRIDLCKSIYPDVPGISAFPDITQYGCGHSFSGYIGNSWTPKTTCYDSIDRDVNNCCISGNPRFLPRTITDTIGLQLASCDPNLSPANYANGMCDTAFMGSCPYDQADLMKRIKNYNNTGSYRSGGGGTIKGYVDTNDKCGQWMDALSKSPNKNTSDVVKKMIAGKCTKALLASETGETNIDRGVFREWCRQNPGYCDAPATEYCTEHIAAKCGSASDSESCVKYAIDPFCTCIYWSSRGMKQPQCFSSECQGGRGVPGYKTVGMSTVGNECGAYCQQEVRVMGKDITIGDISQSCNMVQSLLSETNPAVPIDSSGSGESGDSGDSNMTIYIAIGVMFMFFIILVLVVILSSSPAKKSKFRSFR